MIRACGRSTWACDSLYVEAILPSDSIVPAVPHRDSHAVAGLKRFNSR